MANQVFLVIETDESAEAPHAIENSTKVYVRTGNASNPYELAEVDLIVDLLQRRRGPLERRDRLLTSAERRSDQAVPRNVPYLQVSVCPQFPRTPLCSSSNAWDFLLETTHRGVGVIPANSMKRVPDGVGSLTYSQLPRVPSQYVELSRYSLLYVARNFPLFREGDGPEQLHFSGLTQILLRLTAAADRFYNTCGYRGMCWSGHLFMGFSEGTCASSPQIPTVSAMVLTTFSASPIPSPQNVCFVWTSCAREESTS